ncbi:type II toxin-antitoxin system PemK/MazF family toxin [Psychroflexus salis]|uniref:mRNA interferase MazF n=1 Tax=Psychroflexus salis TaxID=1526574 RepID=A0A917E8D8_9FLAO|nr:type II toxin-antitoxin system PemK/MazF family toxin [Psychroflexus salis]GGE10822.1 hypothetical protein GCM10010831_10370 [Psychroflexus salis]
MKKGDIVLIPFPFTDLSGIKKRPAVILVEAKDDITVSFMTTQLKWKTNHDMIIKPTELNGLKMNSLIRVGKIVTLNKNLAIGKLGELKHAEIADLNNSLISLLKLN